MKKHSNQDIEQYYFKKFLEDYQLPSGTISYSDKPDVVIKGERKIGIEITNFYHKCGNLLESEQTQSRWRKEVVSTAQAQYQEQNGKKFEISFGFDKSCPIKHKKTLIDQLIHLAMKIQNCKTGEIRRDLFNYIPELSHVYLNNQAYEDTKWQVVQVHNVPILRMEQLLDIVKKKEQLSKKYEKCDVYWLLVIIDFFDPAQDQEIRVDVLQKIETDVFERVIVYKTILGHVLELKGTSYFK